jgi:hypothetical protein
MNMNMDTDMDMDMNMDMDIFNMTLYKKFIKSVQILKPKNKPSSV